MERLLSFALGGLALALYAPYLVMSAEGLQKYSDWWIKTLGSGWYSKIFAMGPGIFAGIALILIAIRSKS